MFGQAIYMLILVSCFTALLLTVGGIGRIIGRKRRTELRTARHAQAAADMAEWDRLCQAVIINEIRGADNEI